MKQIIIAIALAAVASSGFALDDCSQVAGLNALYGLRDLVIRGYNIDEQINDQIDLLRGPLPNGGYQWVTMIRPSGTPPFVKKEHTVRAVQGSGDPDTFEASASSPFAVAVVVPRKRSLFNGNNESWVGAVVIRYTIDGQSKTRREVVNQWLKPDTTRTFDLGVIADNADVSVETATRDKFTDGSALVEIHLRQAVPQDLPDNPNYETIRSLERIRSTSSAEVLDEEIEKLERRLFPSLTHYYAIASLFEKTQKAEALLRSQKQEDKDKGAAMLKEVVKEIKY